MPVQVKSFPKFNLVLWANNAKQSRGLYMFRTIRVCPDAGLTLLNNPDIVFALPTAQKPKSCFFYKSQNLQQPLLLFSYIFKHMTISLH